jgi:hypothetical protein
VRTQVKTRLSCLAKPTIRLLIPFDLSRKTFFCVDELGLAGNRTMMSKPLLFNAIAKL